MISIQNLYKSFGAQKVLTDVGLEIAENEVIAIVGPSGTGKSVLLKIITGLLEADSGDVLVKNRSICKASAAERREIVQNMGVLFQGAALFDSLNVLENVAFPLRWRKDRAEKSSIIDRALHWIDAVGLGGYELALPGEISIGMRKRVGIARALVTSPEILLFDEPNTGLDPQVGQDIYDLINQTRKLAQFTGIVISHEIPEVFQVCDRVIMLYQGQVQYAGSAENLMKSNNKIVEQFTQGKRG